MKTQNLLLNPRALRLGLALALDVALLIGLLLAMDAAHPTGAALAQGPRYVAPAPIGDDGNDNPCTDKNNPCATIQHAVDQADAGDEIRVARGTYTDLHARAGITQVVYISKTMTIRGGYTTDFTEPPDPTANPTTLDAQGQGRVFYITGDISPIIEGLRITGGLTPFSGGGVYAADAAATIRDNQIFENAAMYNGGGLYLARSDATVGYNTIANNRASSVHLQAGRGGGIAAIGNGSPLINNNTVISNYASYYGGGIYVIGSAAAPTLNSNHIISNSTSNNGGGIFIDDFSSPTLINNVIAKNHASSNGAGVYIDYYSRPNLFNNTIVANNLGPSWANEGIFICNTPSFTVVNTIIVTHSYGIRYGGTGCTYTLPVSISLDYNDVWACSNKCYSGVDPGPHDISVDPRLVDPKSGDYHIQCDSPVIDMGTYDGAPAADFDGDTRPLGTNVDIGADESNCLVWSSYLAIILK